MQKTKIIYQKDSYIIEMDMMLPQLPVPQYHTSFIACGGGGAAEFLKTSLFVYSFTFASCLLGEREFFLFFFPPFLSFLFVQVQRLKKDTRREIVSLLCGTYNFLSSADLITVV